ncbi:hypothetical protein B0H10DRAFT_2005430 [Mycena sp. CBHHK59/15]|nr:hypothetical protein B0H10DRAFT_2005430 [Mycena sp. CBHHK59/15]
MFLCDTWISLLGLQVSVEFLIVILLCPLGFMHLHRRHAARRRQFARRPILGVDLATHYAIPFEERLPHFPSPKPAEQADLDIRPFESLRPPRSPRLLVNRRHFAIPGSPNQQILSPRLSHSQRRLPHQHPLPPSLPTTPVLPFTFPLPPPPSSPACDIAHFQDRTNSNNEMLSPGRLGHYSPPLGKARYANPIPVLTRTRQSEEPSPKTPDRSRSAWKMAQDHPDPAIFQNFTRMKTVLPLRLATPDLAPSRSTSPQVGSTTQSSPVLFFSCPTTPIYMPSSPATPQIQSTITGFVHSQNQQALPIIPLHPCVLSPALESPPPRICVETASSISPDSTCVRTNMDILNSTSPTRSSIVSLSSRGTRLPGLYPETAAQSVSLTETLKANSTDLFNSSATSECTLLVAENNNETEGTEFYTVHVMGGVQKDPNCRLRCPFFDVHNTPRTIMQGSLKACPLQSCLPSGPRISALISPPRRSNASNCFARQPDRRAPVYQYHPGAPAVAIAEGVVRPAQDAFKNFSAGLAVKFEMKGLAESGATGPMAPAKKKNKKKKKKVKGLELKNPVCAIAGPSVIGELDVSQPPSPIMTLLPAFHPAECAAHSPRLSTTTRPPRSMARFVIDLTSPSEVDRALVESVLGQRIVNKCHPDCDDIYCPGGCSGNNSL